MKTIFSVWKKMVIFLWDCQGRLSFLLSVIFNAQRGFCLNSPVGNVVTKKTGTQIAAVGFKIQKMMKRAAIYIVLFFLLFSCTSAQYMTGGSSYDISDNLDLEAVAYLFGESADLRDFEYRLNDPEIQISNLDLNRDGYIDYLRVVDASGRGTYLVVVQAVLGRNMFQDVATISVGRDAWGRELVEITGDDYIYGANYILVPEYARQPVIFGFFGSSRYEPWRSPYHWNYYPSYYVHRRPWPVTRYHEHIHRHHYAPHSSHYAGSRRISVPDYDRRNDYGSRRPENSFINRNQGAQNKQELNRRRSESPNGTPRPSNVRRSTDQPVGRPQAVPSSGQETPTRRERTTPPKANPDSKPAQEQQSIPAKSESGRRSREKVNSSSTQKTNTTRTNDKNTASPSVRTESTSRRQTTPRPAKETKQQSKSGSPQTTSGSGRR